ncbi:MAG: hydantoinase/oxoprolinase family protein [Pseudomonadota bacterium]|nr:hydantoinase/oxoprolinase family protein [Pseudomonadota bacterium]
MVAGRVVGVDVGGTFTDVFFLNEEDGSCTVTKVPTTPEDQSQGIRTGIAEEERSLTGLSLIVHGTTVATNALLERKGALTGIITTHGFRDLIEMRRRDRPDTWGLWGMFEPVVPRDYRVEVDERVLADGSVHTALDAEEAQAAARYLLDKGAEAVAIFFMNAYANDSNERTASEAVRAVWPNGHVTVSSEILPEIREFERCSTATLNAYLQPHVGDYLERLEDGLRSDGFAGQVLMVQSNGGVMSLNEARAFPVRTALSGPAAGVIAGAHIGISAGYPNLITCDMGGTSFDVALINNGTSALAAQTSIDFGLVVRTPMIEISTIGAGGGSIAWVDGGGLLQIGPESAGSDPGPACYGLGNERPTVTDTNLVLGRINGARPIGNLDRLDSEAAKSAIETHVAKPLDIGAMEAAEAVIRVAKSKMAGAIRLVSVERGHDPKKFVAMPFGGGGSLHTGALIKDIGLAKALVPRFPGVTSALGCVIADMRFDRVHTINVMLDDLDVAALENEMMTTAENGLARLKTANANFQATENFYELDMLYAGQTHTVSVSIDARDLTAAAIQFAFEETYLATFGRLLEDIPARVLNLRVAVIGRRPKFDLGLLAPKGNTSLEGARIEARDVWIDGDWQSANIYRRLDLPVGAVIPGPALLEQPDTTIFIDPGLEGVVDDFGNLVIGPGDKG